MDRRSFLRTTASSTAAVLVSPTLTFGADAPQAPEAELLAQAAERIRRHRQSPGVVAVLDSAGEPVRAARVTVEQRRHDFLFGCNLFRFGRIADADREQQYRREFAGIFNYATLPFYWATYERQRGRPGYDYSDDGAWQGAAAGWLRKDRSRKPVYERMHDLIKRRWSTRVEGETDGDGEFKLTAYHGTHRVVVRDTTGREVTHDFPWRGDKANRVEITLG